MPEELTPAERIADNIINGNISDAKRALRACSKRTVLDTVHALSYRDDSYATPGTALAAVHRLCP